MKQSIDVNKRQPRMIQDFTQGSVAKQLLTFSAPLFLSNLLQLLYNTIDMIVVGQFNGDIGLSAVSIGGDVTAFLTTLVMGFSGAGQIIVAQFLGANRREQLAKFIGTMFVFLMSSAVIISTVCIVFRGRILDLMNTPGEAWAGALAYSTTTIAGLTMIYGYNIVSAILRGMGDSKHPFMFISLAAVMNLLLDLLFVAKMELGPFGAALATVMSQGTSFIISIVFLYHNRHLIGIELTRHDFKINRDMLVTLLKLGTPMAITGISVVFSKLFVNSWINSYGVIVSAVSGIGNKLNQMVNVTASSIHTAGASMVGQNIGAETYERVPKIMFISFIIVLPIIGVGILAMFFFPAQIFSIFTQDPEVIQIGLTYAPILILAFIGGICRTPFGAFMNGSGNYKINFSIAILDGMINRIGFALLLGLIVGMGYRGFWLGDAIAGFTPPLIGTIYLLSGRWKTRKYVIRD